MVRFIKFLHFSALLFLKEYESVWSHVNFSFTLTPACKQASKAQALQAAHRRGGCKGQAGQLARADKASFFSYLLHHRSQKSPLDEPSLFPSSLDGLWRAKKYVQLCLLFSTE